VQKYVDAVEHGPDSPVTLQRPDTDEMRLHARLQPGQLLLVQETYDPAWKAYVNGTAVPTAQDGMHFLLVDAGAGDRDVTLRFETPLENRAGQVIFFLSVIAVGWLVWPSPRRTKTA
jgi:uncharacterized membrane protein YfhO